VTAVGIVGMGAMGTAVASRLGDAGHEVRTWNRTPPGPESPADVARASELVVVLVSDPEALAAVTEGPVGLAAGCRADATVAQMSTVSPAAIERLARALPRGVELLDAPLHGAPPAAQKGEAVVFAGGEPAPVERWTELLGVLGTVVPTGRAGTGTAAKLVCNASLFGTLGLLGEALALADRLGLDRDVAFDALATTPLAAQADRRREAVQTGSYPSRFGLALACKDADLLAAQAPGLPILEAVRGWLHAAEDTDPDRDYTAVIAEILGA